MGRCIGKRENLRFDFDEICRAAARHQVALEVNAHPSRLDLPDEYVRRAISHGVRLAVSTGAHSVSDLAHMRLGVATAQRGWATSEDVINAWPLDRLRRFLAKGDAARENQSLKSVANLESSLPHTVASQAR
jgi:DNA polymerase (family 10)